MCQDNTINIQENSLYHTGENKRNMWIYCYKPSNSVFIIDPIHPQVETIQAIDDMNADNLFIVLTACQMKKKQYTQLWIKIFPKIKVICPDHTFIPNEYIIPLNTMQQIPNHPDIWFLSIHIVGAHALCMKSNQLIFVGELIHNMYIYQYEFINSQILFSFFDSVDKTSIILPSYGSITMLGDLVKFGTLITEAVTKKQDDQKNELINSLDINNYETWNME